MRPRCFLECSAPRSHPPPPPRRQPAIRDSESDFPPGAVVAKEVGGTSYLRLVREGYEVADDEHEVQLEEDM